MKMMWMWLPEKIYCYTTVLVQAVDVLIFCMNAIWKLCSLYLLLGGRVDGQHLLTKRFGGNWPFSLYLCHFPCWCISQLCRLYSLSYQHCQFHYYTAPIDLLIYLSYSLLATITEVNNHSKFSTTIKRKTYKWCYILNASSMRKRMICKY